MLTIGYGDVSGAKSERVVWPFLIGFAATTRVVVAWCELRGDFRIFRSDRITTLSFLEQRYPESPVVLRRRWLALMAERRRQEVTVGPERR